MKGVATTPRIWQVSPGTGGDLGFYPRASAQQNLCFFADIQGVPSTKNSRLPIGTVPGAGVKLCGLKAEATNYM